jgi:hypothetical protein
MASVVEGVTLLDMAGHCYRQRIHPITGSRDRGRTAAEAQQADWQEEEFEEMEILTIEDEQIDESLISQEGDSYVTQISADPQVSSVLAAGWSATLISSSAAQFLVVDRCGPRTY